MYFQYDSNGVPFGFIYNNSQYFYLTNQLGDVAAIANSNGFVIAQYNYDEWGRLLSIDASAANTIIANANPIRYRGYYYDNETGYYYLQSRYYDANICRFINSDIPEIAQKYKDDNLGTNGYIYCSNNSINNIDPVGYYNYKALGQKGILLLSKSLQKKVKEMKQHNYRGFSLHKGKVYCVSAVHYTAYWYGTTLRYDICTYSATVEGWYAYIDAFKKAAKKAGIVQKILDSSTLAAIAGSVLKLSSKKIAIVTKALSITLDILLEIKQGVLDKVEKNLRNKKSKTVYCFNLYVRFMTITPYNTSKLILGAYTNGIAAIF